MDEPASPLHAAEYRRRLHALEARIARLDLHARDVVRQINSPALRR
jgi:hypothetical protein